MFAWGQRKVCIFFAHITICYSQLVKEMRGVAVTWLALSWHTRASYTCRMKKSPCFHSRDWFNRFWKSKFWIETAATARVSVCAPAWAHRGRASEVKWPLQSAVCETLPDLSIHSAGSGDWTDMWQKCQQWRSAPPRTAAPGWSQTARLVTGRKKKKNAINLFLSSKNYLLLCNGCESLCSLKSSWLGTQSK